MASGCKPELPRGCGVEEPGGQYAVLHDGEALGNYPLGIEGSRAQAAHAPRIVDDVDARLEQPFPELVLEEARLARHGGGVDSAREMTDERTCDPPVEYDRCPVGLDLARIEAPDRPLAGRASHLLGRIEIGAVDRRGIVVVPLHRGAFAHDPRHCNALARAEI